MCGPAYILCITNRTQSSFHIFILRIIFGSSDEVTYRHRLTENAQKMPYNSKDFTNLRAPLRWARKIAAALVITCAGKYLEKKMGDGKAEFLSKQASSFLACLRRCCCPSSTRRLRSTRAPSRSSSRNPLSFPIKIIIIVCAFQKYGIVFGMIHLAALLTKPVIRVAAFHFLFPRKGDNRKRFFPLNIKFIFIFGDFLTLIDRIRFSLIKKNWSSRVLGFCVHHPFWDP